MRKPAGTVNLGEIAVFTGLSYRTLRRMRKDGLLPSPVVDRGNNRRYWTSRQIRRWWRSLEATGGHARAKGD